MIQLKAEGWIAHILPEYGMNTIYLSLDGEEIIRSPESEEPLRRASRVYGIPLLLPPNRTENGEFTFEGIKYNMPINDAVKRNHIHGFISQACFEVLKVTQTSVTARYVNRGEIYPFPFSIEVCYSLTNGGYHQVFRICNTGPKNMPITFGLHTNFVEKGTFSIPISKSYEVNEYKIPTGRLIELSERELEYKNGTAPRNDTIDRYYKSDGKTARIGNVEYIVSDNFNCWVLYSGDGKKGFLSMEPQCGAVNCLNTKDGLLCLGVGEEVEFSTLIRMQ